jgi:hypothetical protein
VQKVDTSAGKLWRAEPELAGDTPGSVPIVEESYDEIRVRPGVPAHLRALVPPSWKKLIIQN